MVPQMKLPLTMSGEKQRTACEEQNDVVDALRKSERAVRAIVEERESCEVDKRCGNGGNDGQRAFGDEENGRNKQGAPHSET